MGRRIRVAPGISSHLLVGDKDFNGRPCHRIAGFIVAGYTLVAAVR